MITVTFIRHGESTDNIRNVWAGWKDAPLTNHGFNQATSLGSYFTSTTPPTRFAVIYTSDLQRAHSTASAVHSAQLGLYTSNGSSNESLPPLIINPIIREQNFGVAEGQVWSTTGTLDVVNKIFPILPTRADAFPTGESLDDVALRVSQAIDEIIIPHVLEAKGKKENEVGIAVVSHGIAISEMVACLLRRSVEKGTGGGGEGRRWTGLQNTAWTRVVISLVDEGEQGENKIQNGSAHPLTNGSSTPSPSSIPLKVQVTATNVQEHLVNITRQKGGIGSSAYDPKQSDIRKFFGGGGGVSRKSETTNGEGATAGVTSRI